MCSQFWSLKAHDQGASLVVHLLRLHTQEVWVLSTVKDLRSHMPMGQKKQNIKWKQCCNEFNEDVKSSSYKKWLP